MSQSSQQGIIAIYVALLVAMIVTSGAIALSGILSRQIRFASDVVINEQAFYLADSGSEALLYALKAKIDTADTSESEVSGSIEYEGGEGTFTSQGKLQLTPDLTRSQACVESTGTIKGETRRIAIGPTSCDL